jgi:hypothetical protein
MPDQRDHVVDIGSFHADPMREGARLSTPRHGGRRHVLVQLRSASDRDQAADLGARFGLRLRDYVPAHAYLEYLRDDVLDALGQEPLVRVVVDYPELAKIDQVLLRTADDPERRAEPQSLDVTLFDEVDLPAALAELRALDSADVDRVLDDRPLGGQVHVRLGTSRSDVVRALARLGAVRWVEPVPRVVHDDVAAAATLQSGNPVASPLWDAGLHGEGEVVGMLDDGPPDLDHCFFRDPAAGAPGPAHRKVVSCRNASSTPVKEHATIVAGLVAGDELGRSGKSAHRGGAWAARLAIGNSRDVTSGTTLLQELSAAAEAGAAIHTNSWHRAGQGEGLPATYDGLSADTDRFCWENEDHLVLGSSGNLGEEQGPPGTAKNALCVSAARAYPDQALLGDGSPGPTADGRVKPDLMTMGCSVVSARHGSPCRLTIPQSCASSWATPELAAGAALLRQHLRAGRRSSSGPGAAHEPSGALLKAMLIASTVPPGDGRSPDPARGWGVAQLDRVLGAPLGSRQPFLWDVRLADGLHQGDARTTSLVVTDGQEPLEATLVWTDPPAMAGAGAAMVNGLELQVAGPGGAPGPPPLTDHGSVRRVVVTRPEPGPWSVTVLATDVRRHDVPQGFAVVVIGAVAERDSLHP